MSVINECILVGNGNGVKGKNFKDTIDSYQNVVRFNRFQIKGYEEYIGTKCTHWVVNGKLTLRMTYVKANYPKIKKQHEELESVILLTTNELIEKRLLDLQKVLTVDLLVHTFDSDNIDDVFVPITWGKHKPSTGFLAVLYFLNKFNTITLYGFDFGKTHHYWGSRAEDKPGKHDWEGERVIIESFIDEGRIINLS